jgi:hypothetical protein
MSNEAHFHVNGDVNKQKFLYFAVNNPREINQKPFHSPKVRGLLFYRSLLWSRTFLKMRMVKR